MVQQTSKFLLFENHGLFIIFTIINRNTISKHSYFSIIIIMKDLYKSQKGTGNVPRNSIIIIFIYKRFLISVLLTNYISG